MSARTRRPGRQAWGRTAIVAASLLLGRASGHDAAEAPAAGATRPLRPYVECVAPDPGGGYTAHFGYVNEAAAAVTLPAGPANEVSPGPADRGQPTSFAPGRTPRFPRAAFRLAFDGREVRWTLTGPDGRTRTATASASSRRCAAVADRGAPLLRFAEPAEGAVLGGRTPRIRLVYEDDGALDLASLRVTVDGVDRTSWFSAGPREAVAEPSPERALDDGRHRIEATIRDDAGRAASASRAFTVGTLPPSVTVVQPGDGASVSGSAVDVVGGVSGSSPVRVTVGGMEAVVSGGTFRAVGVPLGEGPQVAIPVVARDAAGHTSTAELRLRVERQPPSVRIAWPLAGTPVGGPRVRVRGTVQGGDAGGPPVSVDVNGRPAEVEGGAFQADVPIGPGTRELSLRAVARSASGLTAEDSVSVAVDARAPALTVESPRPGTVTREDGVRVAGRVDDPGAAVRVNGTSATSKDGRFSTVVPLPADGPHRIVVVAEDQAGNRSSVEIPVRVDRKPPSLKLLDLGEDAPLDARAAAVFGTAEDDSPTSVTVDGHAAERLDRAWRVDLGALAPGRKVVEVVARDEAGNETRLRRAVTIRAPAGPTVVAPVPGQLRSEAAQRSPLALAAQAMALQAAPGDGAVVGQVLSDATGQPVAHATVTLSPGGQAVETDEAGRFSFAVAAGPVWVSARKDSMTYAEREATVPAGVGVVAIDARLTPLGEEVPIDGTGGTLQAELPRRLRALPEGEAPPSPVALTVTIPPGALAGSNKCRLTPLSGQGLPGLLPLGYSPVLAFGLEASTPPASFVVHAAPLPDLPLHLVVYDVDQHAWTLAASPVQAVDGAVELALSGLGTWALVVVDPANPPTVMPAVGGTLPPAAFAAIPEGATSRTLADPPSLPGTGGTSHGRIEIDSPAALPSGTVVQAVVSETYRLTTGVVFSSDERYQDVLVYRADIDGFVPAEASGFPLAAELPIVASRQFPPAELQEGRVLLRIFSGREDSRAAGGSAAVTVSSGDSSFSVPAGALDENTAIAFRRASTISPGTAETPGVTPIAEFVIDLSGATLGIAGVLSVPAAGLPSGGSFFVARAELVGAETRYQVVAWAERDGDRVVTVPRVPLPGLRQGGRYVLYHAAPAVAFLAGTVRAGDVPQPALVTTSRLPFVGLAGSDGAYSVLTLAGTVRASARVLGTSLVGSADADVAALSVLALDILLADAVTTATVTPSSGATGVPVTRQVEVEASAPLDPAFATAASVRLRRASDGAAQAVQTVLSGSGRQLAVMPETPLAYLTTYTFEAAGLQDVYGRPVAVPVVTFTTQAQATTAMNLDALVFSFPVNGIVKMKAPAGALPAGSRILVVNVGNGSVISSTVGALAVEAELRASIDDRLWVTVTDPQGQETTFERTEYVAPDGKTAVGVAGGKVRASNGAEMRLPKGATDRAVTIKLTPIAESGVPKETRPDLPGAHFGAGLKITSADEPRFAKEVDLAFPVPPGAPEGAFFYVYRRIALDGGRVAFETIDRAAVESGKVVTASPPFSGYWNSYASLPGGGALQPGADNDVYLMWTFDSQMPGRPTSGVITGQVLRAGVDPATGALTYGPVPGAVVSGVNDAGYSVLDDPDGQNVSVSVDQDDGTFTMLDAHYTGGTVAVSARTPQGETKIATAFQSNPMDSANYGLRFFQNIARVTFIFDPLTPPPGPATLEATVVRVGPEGQRLPTDGLIVEGSRLLVGIRRKNATVEGVSISGQAFGVVADPVSSTQPLSFDLVTSEEFVASPPGSYRGLVVAHDDAGRAVTAPFGFRVVAEGAGNEGSDPDSAPFVLEERTSPRRDAVNVPVASLVQVHFSEPVHEVPGNVHLFAREPDGQTPGPPPAEEEVEIRVLGLPPGAQTAVDVTPASQSSQPVVSLVIEARPGLKFGKKYRLELGAGIEDLDRLDQGGPRHLETWSTTFTTQSLADATGYGTFPSPRVVVQDGYAYLVENEVVQGTLKVFDVHAPSAPVPVPGAERTITNRPVDLAARPERLVVGTTVPSRPTPSNVHIFDVTQADDPRWTGVASVTSSVVDGALLRLVMRGSYVYALAVRKGVQVVDVRRAEKNFAETGGPTTTAYWRMIQQLNTDGQGFGQDAVIATLPLPVTPQTDWYPHDLDVGDYVLAGRAQPVVFAAAEERKAETCPLLVGSPLAGAFVHQAVLRSEDDQDLCPVRVALGRVAGLEVAVLGVGFGRLSYRATGWGLAVVDISDPASPRLVGLTRLGLPDISDVVLDGESALVASSRAGTDVVSLASPERPYVAGHIGNLSGSLAVGEDGTYFSSGGTYGSSPEGGLHVSVPRCDLLSLRDERLELEVVRDPKDGSLCGGGDVLVLNVCEASRVTLRIDGQVPTLDLDGTGARPLADVLLAPGQHVVAVPFGTIGTSLDEEKAFAVFARSQADASHVAERQGRISNKLLNRPVLPVGRTFVKGVDLLDGHLVRQATDVKVQGRHLGLEVTRTYSSAAKAEDGSAGAGWSWNYEAALTPSGCQLYNVSTADGSGVVFRSSEGGTKFTPQRGYHGKLEKLPDESFRFTDKAGVKHYFKDPVDPLQPLGARRLDRVVEPHGDRLEVGYDLVGRVSSVREVLRGERAVRSLDFRYVLVDGHDRLSSVESNLGHRVDYGYDPRGNLASVKRSGGNVDGEPDAAPATESYEYTVESPRDPHQMTAAVGPNGDRAEYSYYQPGDTIPGEGQALAWLVSSKEELVREVREIPGAPTPDAVTRFGYDFSQGANAVFTSRVTDARSNDTVYTLNRDGSPTRIQEPLGKETVAQWKDTDILKEWERDAEGRTTHFEYDDNGNLRLEWIEKGGPTLAETKYHYDPAFNKLDYKRDAEGRETFYTINLDTGDLMNVLDPVKNFTEHHYDADGRLDWTKDPRGYTTYFRDFNDYGSPREIENPRGQLTHRNYDSRNRLREERQDPYPRITQTKYDGFDRPVEQVRVSGQPNGDERTTTEYYPGGEPRSMTNPFGGKTEYALDGMNRVVGTSIVVGDETLTTGTQYDGNGNAVVQTDRRGVVRKNTYDELNRLRKVEIESGPGGGPLGQVAAYTYYPVGNKHTETDVNGLVTEFVYDGLYRVKDKILPATMPEGRTPAGPLTEHFVYDKVGNLLSATDANGKATTTEYDGLNRPTKVTRDAGGLKLVTTTTYNDPERVRPESHVNKSEEHDESRGLRTTYQYDELNREVERKVYLEGEDGDPGPNPPPYPTSTVYEDDAHAVRITDPRGMVTRRKLDGLDRVVEQTVDTGGLGGAAPLNLTTTTVYDSLLNRKSVTDPENHTTVSHYDVLGRLVTTTDAKEQETSLTYDGEGLKASETDRRGVKKLFTYDNLGRPRTTRLESAPFSGVGWSHETQYVDSTQPKRIEIDARGKKTVFDLDGLGRVVKETDLRQNFRTFTWDGVNKVAETDKRHNETRFEYDAVNRLTKTTDPLVTGESAAHTVETTYEDALNRVTEKDRRGYLKRTQLDPLGRVVSVTRAVGTPDEAVLETNSYDGNSNKTLLTDAEGKKTRFEYDAANRVSARTDGLDTPVAALTTFVYDKVGNPLEERDARAAELGEPWSVKRTYDELNRLWTETNGEKETQTYGYDPEGSRTSVRTPNDLAKGLETSFTYDELGKLLRVLQPPPDPSRDLTPLKTEYVYDENRNRILQTDARLHSVKMEYDELNRLNKTTQDPGGLDLVTETVKFDENGNPEIIKDPKKQTITSTFDELNRLKSKSYAFAQGDAVRPWRYTESIGYGYDENGNLLTTDEHVVSQTDPKTRTLRTARTYDGLDRLATETQRLPDGTSALVKYSYFKNGLRKTVTDSAESVTQYTYDGQNRLETATTGFGTADAQATSYTYWPDDLLHTVSYPNGVVATHDYDKADRLWTLKNAKGATPVSSYAYTYDDNGNRITQVEANGGLTETTGYTYDDLDRLHTITYPADAAYPQGRVVTYVLDEVGNRIRETEKDSADVVLADKQGVFDNANRLRELQDLVTPAQSTHFTWDPNGNQLTKTTAGVTTENRYDLRDKLVEVVEGASTLGRFQYDAAGRRSLKIGDEGLRQYVYDQTSLFAEYDAAGLQKAKYDYGSDRLISLSRPGDEGRRYFSLDGLRSVVNLTDDSGAAVASYHLDTWGNFRFPDELTASANRFAFTGHIFDTETGLYNAKARYFDPKLGRFLTQDSYLGQIDNPPSLHRYFYGLQNPLRYVDTTGHSADEVRKAVKEGKTFRCGEGGCYIEDASVPVKRESPTAVDDESTSARAARIISEQHASDEHHHGDIATDRDVPSESPEGTITEDLGAQSTGSPSADALLRQRRDTTEAIQQFGKTGKKTLETAWDLLPGSQAVDIVGGEDVRGEKVEVAQAGGQVLFAYVAVRVIYRIGQEVVSLAKAARVSGKSVSELRKDAMAWLKAKREIETARKAAVKEAWKQEERLLRETGRGTRAWTEKEKRELLRTGKVGGYEGHHVNNVADNPDLARDPNNIAFAKGRSEHLDWHEGNFRNATEGPVLDRTPPSER